MKQADGQARLRYWKPTFISALLTQNGYKRTPPENKDVIRGCIQKFPDWVDNEIHAYKNNHSLRINTKGYDGKTH